MDKTELRTNLKIKEPKIHRTAFVAEGAHIIGDVTLKKESSVWYNSVLRADINKITIAEDINTSLLVAQVTFDISCRTCLTN